MRGSSVRRRLLGKNTPDPATEQIVLSYCRRLPWKSRSMSAAPTTVGLSAAELIALLDTADAHSTRFGALVSLLAYNGVRIDEALPADVPAYTYQQGHRVLRITRKCGRHSLLVRGTPWWRSSRTR